MNTQKNAAWYRHQSWHRQTIIPALMPCSNGAWRFLPLPDRAKHKQKKARNYAGLAAFHAIRCLAVPDAESFPLDDIRPERWTSEFTTGLLELLWVLEATLTEYPKQKELLEAVVKGPLFQAVELPEVPAFMRKAPSQSDTASVFDQEEPEDSN